MVIAAGGIAPLCELTARLPKTLPAAVLVQPTSLDPFGPLADLLGRSASLPVSQGVDGGAIKVGHVFLAPPDRHLLVVGNGTMALRHGAAEPPVRRTANPLFHSAALAFGGNVIGIVLSEPGGNGTSGRRALKALGGILIVEGPLVPPLATTDVDYCCSAADIADVVVALTAL